VAVIIVVALVYFGLGLAIFLRRERPSRAEQLLAAYSISSALLQAALALDSIEYKVLDLAPGIWLAVAGLSGLCLLGALTFTYLKLKWGPVWLLAIPLLGGALFAADSFELTNGLSELTWREALSQQFSLSTWAATLAWGLIGFGLLGITFRLLSQARLPLHANRILWWLLVLPLILVGEGLAIWGTGALAIAGQIVRLAGTAGVAYGVLAADLLDVRGVMRSGVGNSLFIAVTAVITLVGIGLAKYLDNLLDGSQWQIAVAIIALVLALFYQAIRTMLGQVVEATVLRAGYNTAQTSASYSKRIAEILDLGELAAAANDVLTRSIEVTKSSLLVLTHQEKQGLVHARAFDGRHQAPVEDFQFQMGSIFINTLADDPKPLLQFTLDVGPQFKQLAPAERKWLHQLEMDAYVPILLEGGVLGGILAVGSRKTGDPYRARELELLSAIADQTSVALKNARLVGDLRKLNEDMQVLNKSLAATNERLKEHDKVKTDFITIASHELRTPLTQIGGFSELLTMLSQSETIPGPDVADISDSITKACERLSEVVGQMLEVSEIDIEMVQLKIAQTHMNTILRVAVEPFTAAIRERGLVFSVQGVRNLPPLQADEQRLGQAFSQLIGNAIKYTPDGRRIEVQGRYLPRDNNRPEVIEIVVADSGIGISAKYLDMIFEKFFRIGGTGLHSTGTTKFMGAGPGLGLPIAKGIIEAHGGRIWAESPGYDKDKFPGAKIYVVLPLKPSPFIGKNAPSLIGEVLNDGITS
jgi:signal transduction histidine kinase